MRTTRNSSHLGGLHQAPPGTRHPPEPDPLGQDPPDQAPPRGQTHTCKHITLPQTSFAGGKNADNYNFRHHFAQSIVWWIVMVSENRV